MSIRLWVGKQASVLCERQGGSECLGIATGWRTLVEDQFHRVEREAALLELGELRGELAVGALRRGGRMLIVMRRPSRRRVVDGRAPLFYISHVWAR